MPLEKRLLALSVEVFNGRRLCSLDGGGHPRIPQQPRRYNTVIGALPVIWLLATSFPALRVPFTAVSRMREAGRHHPPSIVGGPWLIPRGVVRPDGAPSGAVDIVVSIAGGALVVIWAFTIGLDNFIGKVTRPEASRPRTFGTIFFFQTLMGGSADGREAVCWDQPGVSR